MDAMKDFPTAKSLMVLTEEQLVTKLESVLEQLKSKMLQEVSKGNFTVSFNPQDLLKASGLEAQHLSKESRKNLNRKIFLFLEGRGFVMVGVCADGNTYSWMPKEKGV